MRGPPQGRPPQEAAGQGVGEPPTRWEEIEHPLQAGSRRAGASPCSESTWSLVPVARGHLHSGPPSTHPAPNPRPHVEPLPYARHRGEGGQAPLGRGRRLRVCTLSERREMSGGDRGAQGHLPGAWGDREGS